MPKRDRPLWREDEDYRRAVVNRLRGDVVVVRFSGMRDPDDLRTVEGRLLGVASANVGTVADLLILDVSDRHYLRALSLATVASVHSLRQKATDVVDVEPDMPRVIPSDPIGDTLRDEVRPISERTRARWEDEGRPAREISP